jgi:hypothetical protein
LAYFQGQDNVDSGGGNCPAGREVGRFSATWVILELGGCLSVRVVRAECSRLRWAPSGPEVSRVELSRVSRAGLVRSMVFEKAFRGMIYPVEKDGCL